MLSSSSGCVEYGSNDAATDTAAGSFLSAVTEMKVPRSKRSLSVDGGVVIIIVVPNPNPDADVVDGEKDLLLFNGLRSSVSSSFSSSDDDDES